MTLFRTLLAAAALALLAAHPARAADPDTLWNLISTRCLPNYAAYKPPAPCAALNLDAGEAHGYAVLKDIDGPTQFLLMPTAKITGIESPAILAPDATNYLAAAWSEHGRMDLVAHRAFPRDAVSLAINAITGRSQNQLHIHIDCVAAPVRAALLAHQAQIGATWAPFPVPLAGHPYLAMHLSGEDFAAVNPFRLIADGIPGAREDMGHQTLVVVGAMLGDRSGDAQPGFILLEGHADLAAGNHGSGEELQDHACRGI